LFLDIWTKTHVYFAIYLLYIFIIPDEKNDNTPSSCIIFEFVCLCNGPNEICKNKDKNKLRDSESENGGRKKVKEENNIKFAQACYIWLAKK
jgi:hypothetical protein